MKLTIENIGAIKKAEITLDNLTIIAGENSSGKTTIGKVIYAQIKSFGSIAKTTAELFVNEAINKKIEELIQTKKLDKEELSNCGDIFILLELLKNKLNKEEHAKLEKTFKEYVWLVDSQEGLLKLLKRLQHVYMLSEFDGQLSSYDKNNNIKTSLDDSNDIINDILFISQSNDFIDFTNKVKLKSKKFFDLSKNAIDGSLDNIESSIILTHQEDFIKFINTKETIINPVLLETDYNKENIELTRIKEEFKDLLNGDFSFNEKEKGFVYNLNGAEIKPANTANGVKTIGYFSQILRLEFLMGNNLLILDEPEISLHPIWQVKFAKILVELTKSFNIKIVVISHSPYFIDAINQVSKKQGLATNFCLLEKDTSGYVCNEKAKISTILKALDQAYIEVDQMSM